MQYSENELRDYLFNQNRDTLQSLICGRREPVQWTGDEFPPIHFLLQQQAEIRINETIDALESLILFARELRLERQADSTTRVDLFGTSPDGGEIIRLTRDEFFACFQNKGQARIPTEIGTPSWEGLKRSLLDTVTVHNLDIYPTGLLREVYAAYVKHIYRPEVAYCMHYSDDFPKWSYSTLRSFLPVWEILRMLGLGSSNDEDEEWSDR